MSTRCKVRIIDTTEKHIDFYHHWDGWVRVREQPDPESQTHLSGGPLRSSGERGRQILRE